ncbi:MAG: 2-isopropylmalate synthase [Betaproteobacteria bacterium]|jgi:2-isopropylmalate synthase|nr:2-isopropylmalate synthase [Betaproteobacteria bacterium]
MKKDRLIIFDTTMRDGEQSPGASMTKDEKLRIARALERMRVDVIEAGFPASSNGDFEAVQAIANTIKDSVVCGLCRANDRDIQRGIDALKGAKAWRVHTFIATSPLHMKVKLRMTPEQVLEQTRLSVRYAKNACPDVEFSPEDGSRSEVDFLCRVLEAAIAEGATTINIPDTVGYAVPEQFGAFIRTLREKIPNSDKAVWSVHCHNDLGMAVANSLAAVTIGGARQVECTINGLGERAGNTSLEEIVMAVRTRGDFFNLETGLDTTQIVPTSRLVSQVTGFVVQPNKAVVGANAFAHASGIHQDGVLKARQTYEIMTAEDVGWTTNRIVLGKLSGRSAFKQRLKEIGIELESEDAYNKAFQRFKDLADKKADIFDEDLQALVTQEAGASSDEHWRLVTMNQASGMGERPHASIVLTENGAERRADSQGDGPVDATFKAIETLAKSGAELLLYSVNAVTQGTESQGEVTVRLSRGGRVVNGVGADTDVIVASAKAYVNALNKLESKMERVNPQHQL